MQADLVKLLDIYPDEEFNCRGFMNKIDVSDLANDIESKTSVVPDTLGLLQPIVIRVNSADEVLKYGKPYSLVAGFRRYFAFQILKRDLIPAIIKTNMTAVHAAVMNLSENIQRKDLNILQEASALRKLHAHGIPRDRVAKELGMSSSWVQVRYNLLELPEEIQVEAASGILNQKQIKEIWSLKDDGRRFEAVKKIKTAKANGESVGHIKLKEKKDDPTKPKLRDKTAIFEMMQHIATILGYGFYTRVMAWSIGEISTYDLLKDLKAAADEKNVSYTIPEAGTIFTGET